MVSNGFNVWKCENQKLGEVCLKIAQLFKHKEVYFMISKEGFWYRGSNLFWDLSFKAACYFMS